MQCPPGGRLARRGCLVPDFRARTGEFITTPGAPFMKYWLDTEFIAHPFMIDHAAFSSRSAVRLLNCTIAMCYTCSRPRCAQIFGGGTKRGPNPLRSLGGAGKMAAKASTPAVEHASRMTASSVVAAGNRALVSGAISVRAALRLPIRPKFVIASRRNERPLSEFRLHHADKAAARATDPPSRKLSARRRHWKSLNPRRVPTCPNPVPTLLFLRGLR